MVMEVNDQYLDTLLPVFVSFQQQKDSFNFCKDGQGVPGAPALPHKQQV